MDPPKQIDVPSDARSVGLSSAADLYVGSTLGMAGVRRSRTLAVVRGGYKSDPFKGLEEEKQGI